MPCWLKQMRSRLGSALHLKRVYKGRVGFREIAGRMQNDMPNVKRFHLNWCMVFVKACLPLASFIRCWYALLFGEGFRRSNREGLCIRQGHSGIDSKALSLMFLMANSLKHTPGRRFMEHFFQKLPWGQSKERKSAGWLRISQKTGFRFLADELCNSWIDGHAISHPAVFKFYYAVMSASMSQTHAMKHYLGCKSGVNGGYLKSSASIVSKSMRHRGTKQVSCGSIRGINTALREDYGSLISELILIKLLPIVRVHLACLMEH